MATARAARPRDLRDLVAAPLCRSQRCPLNLDIFKSYDIRGIYPSELNEDVARRIGRAFADYLRVPAVAIGRDMRLSSEPLFRALADGITMQGTDVVDLGLTTTDELYFAVGHFKYQGGIMITASHNPKQYNGFKLCRADAVPLASDTGVFAIRDLVQADRFVPSATRGQITAKDPLPAFAEHCLSFVDVNSIKPLKIAIDAGNGMAGLVVPAIFKHLPVTLIPLYFELDGTFPNHPASPIEPENMADLQAAVVKHGADLGAAFDGDADRVFITDEHGALVGGDMVTALVARNLLRGKPGATILYNLICSRSVPEIIERSGGVPVRTRVGHSYIKAIMRERNAIFGGEHSGHFYFRDNYYADSGLIALLVVLEVISRENKPVSQLLRPLDTRVRSGEINSHVADAPAKLAALEQRYGDAQLDHLDGLTIQYPTWWANVRPSNTEPLLRLNVEADDPATLAAKRDALLAIIRT
ncbi:MAG: phosphomannomutase/phosphoglucomutase [Candidatus Eremiobacteraeota bacterium]|nr:phosphomannomutase/phosphoglucomutase [Candidatus Eremiobacteraeota bacterium]MBV8366062.1 phosphomannomutase/phosphoglucomutase [Candidatus Eremiobacteraeota bacterium]